MSYQVTIRKEAEEYLKETFDYYEQIRLGFGHDFLLCIEEALSKIERNPFAYKAIYKEVRRVIVRRFPYRLFYIIDSSKIIVMAVFHAQKNPISLQKRT